VVKSLYHMRSTRQSLSARRFPGDPDPSDPLIGARLRFCLRQVEQRLEQALASAGFADIQTAHFKVLRFPPPENERPIDLAQRAGMSKQAMNYLLLQLEELGYVQRVAMDDSAARLVSLTEKGWKVAEIQRATVHQIECEWEQQIGAERFKTFYAVLKELTDA
jgi:DNA-binding MarR family transcriptional regulator